MNRCIHILNMPIKSECFRWMLKLFRSDRTCDLWPSSFAGYHSYSNPCFPQTGVFNTMVKLAVDGVTYTNTKTGILTWNNCSIVFLRNICELRLFPRYLQAYGIFRLQYSQKITYSTIEILFRVIPVMDISRSDHGTDSNCARYVTSNRKLYFWYDFYFFDDAVDNSSSDCFVQY